MTLTGVLLTGGNSTRMGIDKATLVIDDEPLWSRQLALLNSIKPQTILISSRARPEWCPGNIPIILDQKFNIGPLAGLDAVSSEVQSSHFLALAVDMPRMTYSHLEKLWALSKHNTGVCVVRNDRFEPLCAIYPLASREIIRQEIISGNHSLQNLIGELQRIGMMKVIHLPMDEYLFYDNLNTPDDLKNLKKLN